MKPNPSPYSGGIKYSIMPIAIPPIMSLCFDDLKRLKKAVSPKYIFEKYIEAMPVPMPSKM
jgi:hypothetical protein